MKRTGFSIKMIFILTFIAVHFTGYASNKSENEGVIKGKVLCAASMEPLSFADIALINKETGKIEYGTISDTNGEFNIQTIPCGKYDLLVSYVGYIKMKLIDICISGNSSSVDLKKVILTEYAVPMEEVVFTYIADN